MKLQKRHIVLTALILALGAAVYLNWQFSDSGSSLLTTTSKELGAATYVNADTTATADEAVPSSKQTSAADQYFAEAQTKREQAQDKVTDTANEVLKSADSSEEAKKQAVEQASKIENNILCQSNIENILKAKGFTKCLCYISDTGCSVAVLKDDMGNDSALIIKDAVLSQLDCEFNDITIIEV